MSETTEPAASGEPANGVAGVTEDQTLDQAAKTEAPATSDEQQSDDDEGDEQPQRQSRAERRISHLAARAHTAEKQLSEAMALLRQVMPQQTQQPTQQQAAPQTPQADQLAAYVAQQVGPAPRPQDFPAGEFDEGYREARDAYVERRAAARAEQAAMQRIQQAQAAQAERAFVQTFSSQVDDIEKANPGAREAIAAFGARVPAGVANAIAQMGADVAHFIATNPEAEARLRSSRSDFELAANLGELRAAAKAQRAAPAPQLTAAPAPPSRTLRGASAAAPSPYTAQSFEDYKRSRGF